MWRCDNVGGLSEHVTCHLLRFLSIPFFTSFLGLRRARTGGPILTIYTSYQMFLHKEVTFGGRNQAAPHLGVKSLNNLNFGGVIHAA